MSMSPLGAMTPAEFLDAPTTEEKSSRGYDFSPVQTDDLAYALSVFVAAANRKLYPSRTRNQILSRGSVLECQELFLLLSGADQRPPSNRKWKASENSEATLPVAFAALWHEYHRNDARDSICARVLGFYYLMERTAGQSLRRWIDSCPESPETVSMDMIVVESLASVPLSAGGLLSQALLLELLHSLE